MKLLAKEEIAKGKAMDRKKEIDEGAKLATRVDALRELSAKEQSNLTKFREESIKKVVAEVNEKLAEKDALLKEIKEARVILADLRKPLDEEYKILDRNTNEVILREQAVLERESSITIQESNLAKLIDKNTINEQRVMERNTQADRYIRIADQIKNEAARILRDADMQVINMQRDLEHRSGLLARKEEEVSYKLVDLASRDDNNRKQTMFLAEETVRLADMRKTLEIELKRTKNKNAPNSNL